MKQIFSKTLWLMKLLARENKEVQEKLFHHLDTLLSVQIVPSDLALSLKEVSLRLFFFKQCYVYICYPMSDVWIAIACCRCINEINIECQSLERRSNKNKIRCKTIIIQTIGHGFITTDQYL